jgi:hypothetical protein
MDQSKRLINRHLRLEICAVDEVEFHEAPNDHRFNTVTVVMRDRRQKVDPSMSYIRAKLPVLQHFQGGNHSGANWNPRKGDLVYVLFYKEREGVVLGNAWSWAEYPICRPTPYDIADKGGQWMEPFQDPRTRDFPKQPYPAGKKPYCFRWFHGPVTGSTGKGRDWMWLFDYCHLGNNATSCKDCKDIDSVCRSDNHGFKFYSSETESKVAHPLRGEYFAPCGSYWMFDSKCCEDCEKCSESCCSEMYTEGRGYWRIQGATELQALKGHVTHSPKGTVDIHSATSDPDDNTGVRCMVVAPDDDSEDFAFEAIDFTTGAYIRILKTGEIVLHSPVKITLDAPLVEETQQNKNAGCTHGPCSCV